MTIRQWMIVVAVVAPILYASQLLLLSAAYRERAGQYQVGLLGSTPMLMGPNGSHSLNGRPSAHGIWVEKMAEKYLRASRFPWLPVEPDPPEPK
jgi:hypothetical protein